jgi:ABC-type nitrate/sulfonate/bicarbonate transport system permease component
MIRGLRSPDAEARELFHSYSANWWIVLVKLRWPASMPFLFSALRVSAGMAFLAAVIAEWMGSDIGIGFLIVSFAQQFKIAALWASVLVATTLSLAAFFLVGWVEGRVLHWASSNDLPA